MITYSLMLFYVRLAMGKEQKLGLHGTSGCRWPLRNFEKQLVSLGGSGKPLVKRDVVRFTTQAYVLLETNMDGDVR